MAVKRRKTPQAPKKPRADPVAVDVADAICAGLEAGKALAAVCREDGMPGLRTVYDWMDDDPDFAARVARARRIGCESIEDGMLKIATTRDTRDPDDVQHRKLQLWLDEKRLIWAMPGKYGSKVQVGGDGGAPIKVGSTGPTEPPTADLLAGIKALGSLADEFLAHDE